MRTVTSADGRKWTAEEWAGDYNRGAALLNKKSARDFAIERFGATKEEADRLMELRAETMRQVTGDA